MNGPVAAQASKTPAWVLAESRLRAQLLGLTWAQKRTLQLVLDTLLIWLCLWLAFYLRMGTTDAVALRQHGWLFLLAPVITLPIFARFGLYRAVVHCLGSQAFRALALAITLSAVLLTCAIYILAAPPEVVPRSIVVIYWMLCVLVLGGLRVAMRQYFGRQFAFDWEVLSFLRRARGVSVPRPLLRVAIFGAGVAGNQLLATLRHGRSCEVVAFLDEDPQLIGRTVAGVLVHAPDDFGHVLKSCAPDEVLLAIPSASRARRAAIVDLLALYPVRVRTIPGLADLASGRVKADDLREVDVADLLGRDPVRPDRQLLEHCVQGHVVMVTGAGGSIGSELCRQALQVGPTVLILFEQCEFNLYRIHQELELLQRGGGSQPVRVVPILGSVCDAKRTLDVMRTWRVDTVYHAAAYKHVPLVEHNVTEGIVNNVFGTLNCAQSAWLAGVRHFVLISTDKAVRPTNIMGCTKRLSELVLQALSAESSPVLHGHDGSPVPGRTRFVMVRFGNVLGSSGSVIPLFRKQIRAGGPVTVTHADITRYFMTIPEAAQLVIQAGSMGRGGDVFVLDMGEPVKIAQLAEKMILLSGLSVRSAEHPEGDIAIEFVGLRPGEKLYEELLIGGHVTPTDHPMIRRADEEFLQWSVLCESLDEIRTALSDDDYTRLQVILRRLVGGYPQKAKLVDWVHQQRLEAGRDIRLVPAPVVLRPVVDWPAKLRPASLARHPGYRQTYRGAA